MEELTLLQQSSLEKVFLDAGEFKPPYLKASVLQGRVCLSAGLEED